MRCVSGSLASPATTCGHCLVAQGMSLSVLGSELMSCVEATRRGLGSGERDGKRDGRGSEGVCMEGFGSARGNGGIPSALQ